jgi:hypothetical protein
MEQHNKNYGNMTLNKFKVQESTLQRFDRESGLSARGLVFTEPCIVIPVGPILRCYCFRLPKDERWCVRPTGYGAQWLGDFSHQELIICEGEWDFLRLQDSGFDNAVTHTAGAGTWPSKWTPLFAGKKVFTCFDRDRIGQQGAAKAAQHLFPVTKAIRLVDLPLPGTSDANDVSDFFRLGGSADEFRELLRGSRAYIASGRRSSSFGRRFHRHGSRLVSN